MENTEKLENLFEGESYNRTIALMEKLKRLVPVTDDHKIRYLETLISYVDALINGDEINQITSYEYVSPFAKEALKELVYEVHDQILDSYRAERAKLQKEVSRLYDEQRMLSHEVESLSKMIGDFSKEKDELSKILEALKQDLEDTRQNGLKRVQDEIGEEEEKLKAEISTLQDTKNLLNTSIGELRSIIDKYNRTISKLNEEETEITWEHVKDEDSIYGVNRETIDEYILSLKQEYIRNTGVSEDECNSIFNLNCSGLMVIRDFLCNNNCLVRISKSSSIQSILVSLKNKSHFQDEEDFGEEMKSQLRHLKLPRYKKRRKNVDSFSESMDTIPTNINAMMRELYYRRLTTKAVAREQIANAEVKVLLGVIKSIAPEGYDFEALLSTLSDIESAQIIEHEENKLTLN